MNIFGKINRREAGKFFVLGFNINSKVLQKYDLSLLVHLVELLEVNLSNSSVFPCTFQAHFQTKFQRSFS